MPRWEAVCAEKQRRHFNYKLAQPVEVNLPCCLSPPCSLPDLASGGVNLKLDTLNGAALQVRATAGLIGRCCLGATDLHCAAPNCSCQQPPSPLLPPATCRRWLAWKASPCAMAAASPPTARSCRPTQW